LGGNHHCEGKGGPLGSGESVFGENY
jgi:hypothetical protein